MVEPTVPNTSKAPKPDKADLPEFSEQIENALREGGRQIRFDDIEKRYRGKRVWVLDRQKMQEGVMRVVDQAILKSQQQSEGGVRTRRRVAAALATLFGNNRNITSPVDPDQIRQPQRPATPTAVKPTAGGVDPGGGPGGGAGIEDQIVRLTHVIDRAESVVTMLSSAARHGGGGGGGGGGYSRRYIPQQRSPEHDQVLQEIFKTNLDLIQGMKSSSNS